jgi:hypothetical protein
MEDPVRPAAALWLALLAAAGACVPEPPCGLRLCDIREPDCQRATADATACLRGLPPADVPIHVISQQRFLAEAVASGEGNVDRELFKRWMEGLLLFGLAGRDVDVAEAAREQAAWVAAFYQPADRSITIIDRGRPMDSRSAVTLLVHEYTHALQDLTVGLEAFRTRLPDDLDRFLASRAVTEGEASLVEDLAALGLFGRSEQEIAWDEVFGRWQRWARQDAIATKLPVEQSLGHFPYPFGLPYVHAAYRSGGLAAVDRLYVEPPLSAAQVLAGFGVAEPSGAAWAEELGPDSVPALPPRFVLVDTDRLGGWVLDVLVARTLAAEQIPPDGSLARELAGLGRAVRADRLSIFADSQTNRTVASWRLRFSSAKQAESLGRLATLAADLDPRGERGQWAAWRADRDVVLLADLTGDREVLGLLGSDLKYVAVPARTAGSGTATRALQARPGCLGRLPEHP